MSTISSDPPTHCATNFAARRRGMIAPGIGREGKGREQSADNLADTVPLFGHISKANFPKGAGKALEEPAGKSSGGCANKYVVQS